MPKTAEYKRRYRAKLTPAARARERERQREEAAARRRERGAAARGSYKLRQTTGVRDRREYNRTYYSARKIKSC